jgi:hypothetical protein
MTLDGVIAAAYAAESRFRLISASACRRRFRRWSGRSPTQGALSFYSVERA